MVDIINNKMVEAAKKQGKSYETYKKVKTLGTGSFGVAYLVECQSNKVTKELTSRIWLSSSR